MIDSLTNALTTYLPDLPTAATSIIAPAIQGAGVGALGSLVTGNSPLTGALIGGGLGGAYGAFSGNGPLSGSLSNLLGGGGNSAGLLDSNGNYITPPIPPDIAGQEATSAGGIGAAPGGGTYNAAGNIVPAATPQNVGSQASGSAGILGGALGGGGLNKTSLALGALAALGSMFSKPQQGTWTTPGQAQNPNIGPGFNAPLNTSAPGRTATNPWPTGSGPDYWKYGGPEATYFTGNSLKSFGFAHGGDVEPQGALEQGADDGEVSTAKGHNYVQGPGDGVSDAIPAQLSDGEYILTAMDVSRLGNGSNSAGAQRLDEFRKDLAKKTGQKQFIPKAAGGALNSLMDRAA